jgi:hypothetical protein
VTGAIAPTANIYRTPLVLTSATHLRARIFRGGVWSALNEASFTTEAEGSSRLQITEIMYNPVGGDDYEFIELKNIGPIELDPSRLAFDEGIRFTFPPNSPSLAPNQLIVLVRNPAAFAQRYPGVRVDGVYEGQLSNKGEAIRLRDAQGTVMISLEYDDENDWPVSTDGQGDSLVIVDTAQDPNNPANWRASTHPNGSPGVDDRMLSLPFKNLFGCYFTTRNPRCVTPGASITRMLSSSIGSEPRWSNNRTPLPSRTGATSTYISSSSPALRHCCMILAVQTTTSLSPATCWA